MKNKLLLLAIGLFILPIISFAQSHVIGEKFGGGIIFYIDSSGQHGLIGAIDDQKMANWLDAINECKTLRDGGYTDWHLPSAVELDSLNVQKSFFGSSLSGGFHWSSSEKDSEHAWAKEFGMDYWGTLRKVGISMVHAVRNF